MAFSRAAAAGDGACSAKYQPHGLFAEFGGMVDGGDAGLRGVEGAGIVLRVNGDHGAEAMRFSHGGGELRLSVLVGRVQTAVDDCVFAGLVDLGEVGALLVLLADHFDELLDGVGVVGIREQVLRRVEAVGIFVTAQNVDGVAADAHAGPKNEAMIDGVADGGVG
jgi:hypothetical protein